MRLNHSLKRQCERRNITPSYTYEDSLLNDQSHDDRTFAEKTYCLSMLND